MEEFSHYCHSSLQETSAHQHAAVLDKAGACLEVLSYMLVITVFDGIKNIWHEFEEKKKVCIKV